MVITVYMYIMRASWKISYYMYTCIYVSAKCCHPHKIKSLLTYLLRELYFICTRISDILSRVWGTDSDSRAGADNPFGTKF